MLRDRIATDIKTAMKARDARTLATVRLIQSAVNDRDIANRGTGKPAASEEEILQILAKMIKQREESARLYVDGGRQDLADKEREEIAVIETFLPKQLSEEEVKAAAAAAIAETGAQGMRDMGKVVGLLKQRHAGQMDFSRASAIVKALLT
ncbi:GatB/YqeY domain-containing protein [Ensifer soli]|uniref:GatB/YqeY domain-containing protein n=1 Tax=Ciceribacter sp. sgz301302 TaxID=3342379 RepID=UPI0035B78CFF